MKTGVPTPVIYHLKHYAPFFCARYSGPPYYYQVKVGSTLNVNRQATCLRKAQIMAEAIRCADAQRIPRSQLSSVSSHAQAALEEKLFDYLGRLSCSIAVAEKISSQLCSLS